MKTVCVVGLWHLGLVNVAGFLKMGYRVTGIDFDKELVKTLNEGKTPLYEPGLDEILNRYIKSNTLFFTTDLSVIAKSEAIVIAYDTPVDEKDQVNIGPIIKAIKRIAPFVSSHTSIIITSQLPLGTSEKIEILIKKINKKWKEGVVYIPENLRLGSAIECFLRPDMLVFGSSNSSSQKKVQGFYKTIDTKRHIMKLKDAEMVKHALNTYLASAIGYGNEIAHICARYGIDAFAVCSALKSDKRIGKAPILPGLGFAGGTLARDVNQINKLAQRVDYSTFFIKNILSINEYTFNYVISQIKQQLKVFRGKKIGILGLTYKPDTSTLRRSPALKIINKLNKYGAYCFAYDPMADPEEFRKYSNSVVRVKNSLELAQKSDILVLITQWSEFKRIDFVKLAKAMKQPVIIDTKNFLDPEKLKKIGFHYIGYGKN